MLINIHNLCPSVQELANGMQQKWRITAIGVPCVVLAPGYNMPTWPVVSKLKVELANLAYQILQSERANRPAWQHPWEVPDWRRQLGVGSLRCQWKNE